MLSHRPLRSALLLAALSACHGAPEAMSLSITPDPAYTTDDLTLVSDLAVGDQPKADKITTAITWDVDGAAQADLDGASTVPADRTTKGEVWTATAIATRGKHAGVAATASVTIANTLPVATATVANTTPSDVDVEATATATDADADTVAFAWTWTKDGEPTDYTDAIVPASATGRGEIWEATVTPNDGEADGEPVVISTSIGNIAPTVADVTISPVDPTTDATLQAHFTAADVDGDTVALRFEWLVDGVSVQDSDVDTLDGSLFDKHQDVVVRVTPNDGFLDGDTVESAPTTIVNSLPSLASAAVSPDAIRTTDSATCVVAGWADADQDPQDVQFEWTVNGSVVGTAAQLDGALFAKGDAIACAATPFDGEDQGAVVTSAAVTIQNTAPAIASAALSSTAPVEGDTLAVVFTGATDADGDTIGYAYRWMVNGTQVATTPTLGSSLFAKGDTISVIVTPNDGVIDGTPVTSNTATAANSAPVLGTATLSKTNPAEGDTLSVTLAGGTDADGDAITYTYQWLVNGTPVATTPTLGSALFAKGNTIVVQVTPNDGTVNGAPVTSDTATAINTAPVLGGADAVEDQPRRGRHPVGRPSSGGGDVDGDAITYTYKWLVNGTQVATTPTLASSLFAKGNTVVVEVTPNDGTVNGADRHQQHRHRDQQRPGHRAPRPCRRPTPSKATPCPSRSAVLPTPTATRSPTPTSGSSTAPRSRRPPPSAPRCSPRATPSSSRSRPTTAPSTAPPSPATPPPSSTAPRSWSPRPSPRRRRTRRACCRSPSPAPTPTATPSPTRTAGPSTARSSAPPRPSRARASSRTT